MQTALALVLVGALGFFPRFDWIEFDRRARKARTPESVAALEKEIPAKGEAFAFERPEAFRSVIAAWQRVRRPEEAVRVAETWRKDFQPLTPCGLDTYDALSAESAYAEALAHAGRLDDATAAATRLLDCAQDPSCLILVEDGPNWIGVGRELLARFHERRGDYAEALRWYEAWRGSAGWPNVRRAELDRRGACIARCRWRLGQPDAALDVALDTVISSSAQIPAAEPCVWACEIAVRSDRLDALHTRIDAIEDAAKRLRFERSFAVATAFARKDAKALLDALTPPPNAAPLEQFLHPQEAVFVVKYLREIGADALGELLARIARGDARAIDVAMGASFTEALPALRARRNATGLTKDEATRLDSVIDEIESAVPPR